MSFRRSGVDEVAALLTHAKRGFQKLLSEPREWFVLVGDRMVIAGVLTFAFGLASVALVQVGAVAVGKATPMVYVFQVLVGGNLTLLTIVLSINQLVLSREFRTPGELSDQIENVISYRNSVEQTTNRDTVPVTPADFLGVLLDGARYSAQKFGGAVRGNENEQFVEEVDDLVTRLTTEADHINGVLERSQDGIFSALAVTLDTNYSHELNEAQRLQLKYEDEFSPAAHEELAELMESLRQVDIARQYFKSLYMQSELARLSRILLYIGIPAVGSSLLVLLIYSDVTGAGPMSSYLSVIVPVVVTLGFSPLAVLFSFLLRIAMVAQRTVAITPFTTPAQEKEL